MSEINPSEFNIYERRFRGISGSGSFVAKHPDRALIMINHIHTIISECAQKKLSITENNIVVFSERKGVFYVAVLSKDSNINGYVPYRKADSKSFYLAAKALMARGFKRGYYEILDPVFSGGIDWFELKTFDFQSIHHV